MSNSLLYRSQNFNQSDIDDIVNFIDTLGESNSFLRKLSFLSVEVLQNIIHHSDTDRSGNTYAYFEICKEENGYLIKSGNLITKLNSNILEDKLKILSSLNEDEIKDKIKHNLANEDFTEKGGAGIGLLSIQKRTSKGLDYNLEFFQGDFNFIHFEIMVEL